jgi:hypothetical protein
MGRWLRTATAIAAVGLVVGCGQGKDERAKTPAGASTIPVEPRLPAGTDGAALEIETTDTPRRAKPKAKKHRARPASTTGDAAALPAPPPPAPADTGLAVRRAVSDTLAEIGYAGAKIAVSDGGRVVDIGVRASQACSRSAPTGDRLLARIREGHPDMDTVRVTVAGSGLALAAYRRSRCSAPAPAPAPAPPSGTGAVVYSTRGTGPLTTPAFVITARTWTVTYRNDSDFFQASVLKSGRIQPFVLSSTHRGTSTESLRGPGRFQLKVTAGDAWSITVRDGR